jgi:hypothetical protein
MGKPLKVSGLCVSVGGSYRGDIRRRLGHPEQWDELLPMLGVVAKTGLQLLTIGDPFQAIIQRVIELLTHPQPLCPCKHG